MAGELITIATFGDPTSAHVARLKLESAGIRCFVVDENMGVLYGAVTTGGVKLQIAESDYREAERVLADEEEVGEPPETQA